MSDSDTQPKFPGAPGYDRTGVQEEGEDELPGTPDGYLLGEAEVTLTVRVADALKPEAAVDAVIDSLARQGLANYFFEVRDMQTDDRYTVLAGHTLTEEDHAALRAQRQGADDGDQSS